MTGSRTALLVVTLILFGVAVYLIVDLAYDLVERRF